MSKSSSATRISTPNIILLGSFAIGSIACILVSNPAGAVFLGAVALFSFFGVLAALRPSAPDISRINAIQYRDERDRQLARKGFEIVGIAALILSVIEVVVVSLVGSFGISILAYGQLLVLSVAWGVGNAVAVRRG